MNQEQHLELVRTLTHQCMELVCPEKMLTFSEDFAAFILTAGASQVQEHLVRRIEQGLDTTLVAGMFFQVLLEAERLPSGTSERVAFIRKQAKNYLVTRLAGQITLSQFFRLLNLIEENAHRYFEHLEDDWLGRRPVTQIKIPKSEAPEPIQGEALRQALATVPMLPKGRRKLTHQTLFEFLRDSGGQWFRLLDFEARFQINKKTAWAYLNLLHKTGILEHNGEKANKVRYILANRFLRPGASSAASSPRPSSQPSYLGQ